MIKLSIFLKPDCMVAEKGHHKNNHIVYCVRNDISKWTKNHLCRGPELIILGPQHTRLGPWLMSGHRLLIWGPKFLRWEYDRDTEINLSGPRLIMSGPILVMSGPRDNYVGAPTYYVGAPYLLFWGSEMIMLGPDLSSGDPDLLCPGPEIIMWEPRFVGALLVISGPRDNHMGTLTYYVGGQGNYVWARIYHVGTPTCYVGSPDIMWHSK